MIHLIESLLIQQLLLLCNLSFLVCLLLRDCLVWLLLDVNVIAEGSEILLICIHASTILLLDLLVVLVCASRLLHLILSIFLARNDCLLAIRERHLILVFRRLNVEVILKLGLYV